MWKMQQASSVPRSVSPGIPFSYRGGVTLKPPHTYRVTLTACVYISCVRLPPRHYALAQWLLAQIPPHFEPELLDLLATTAAGCSLAQLQAIIAREMRLRGRPTAGIETAAAAAAGVAGAGAAGAGVAGAGAAGGGRGGERQRPQHPDGPWWGEQGGILGDVWEGRFVLAAAAASETPDWREKVGGRAGGRRGQAGSGRVGSGPRRGGGAAAHGGWSVG